MPCEAATSLPALTIPTADRMKIKGWVNPSTPTHTQRTGRTGASQLPFSVEREGARVAAVGQAVTPEAAAVAVLRLLLENPERLQAVLFPERAVVRPLRPQLLAPTTAVSLVYTVSICRLRNQCTYVFVLIADDDAIERHI